MINHKIEVIDDNRVIIHRRLNLGLFCIQLDSRVSEFKEGSTCYGIYMDMTVCPPRLVCLAPGEEEMCFGDWSGKWSKSINDSLNEIHRPYSEIRKA